MYLTHHQIFQQGLSPRITTMITTMIMICNWILHICLPFTRTSVFENPIILSTNNVNWVNLPTVPKSREETNVSAEGSQLPHYCSKVLRRFPIDTAGVAATRWQELTVQGWQELTLEGWQELTHYCAISPAEITMLTNLDFTQHRFNNWEMCVSSEQV